MTSATSNSPKAAAARALPTTIQVYNTLTRAKAPLSPVRPGKIGMYLCGPTVYAEAHIGHMVGPVIFDTIKRFLTYSGYEVTWVVNITDVDDKLINKSQEKGITMSQLAEMMVGDYLANLKAMGVDQIDHMPRATECMGEIIAFVEALIAKGFAYESDGDVFFDVGRDPEYGKLTNRTVEALQGEGGEAASRKRSPADFALWKRAKPGEPSWDSPWGAGRPGWHIECSAMSKAILGETFDIHGGGLDLIFPHHENEIAQSECCHGQPMARVWMHNGLLRSGDAGKVGGRAERAAGASGTPEGASLEQIQEQTSGKISRSKGGGGLAKLIGEVGGEGLRFFLLRSHYRSTVVFSGEAVAESATSLATFHRFFERYERVAGESFYSLPTANRSSGDFEPGDNSLAQELRRRRQQFIEKMDDDFNTGGAISELFDIVRMLNKHIDDAKLEGAADRATPAFESLRRGARVLRELSAVLGIFREAPAKVAAGEDDGLVDGLMRLLIEIRADARGRKDFATADKIRDALTKLGLAIEDRKEGTGWRRT